MPARLSSRLFARSMAAALTLAVWGCSPSTPDAAGDDRESPETALAADSANETLSAPIELSARATDTVRIATSAGTFSIVLFGNDAPKAVDNFLWLARSGAFNGTHIHRVARDFVIQMGDPLSKKKKRSEWGKGGKSRWGTTFDDEITPDNPLYSVGYRRGTVAMANRGPNTNTSQFFICLQDIPKLPRRFTIFGSVLDGIDVLDSIGRVPIVPVVDSTDGRPANDIMVRRVVAPKKKRRQ